MSYQSKASFHTCLEGKCTVALRDIYLNRGVTVGQGSMFFPTEDTAFLHMNGGLLVQDWPGLLGSGVNSATRVGGESGRWPTIRAKQ